MDSVAYINTNSKIVFSDKVPSFTEMQEYVQGYVGHQRYEAGDNFYTLVFNENAALQRLPRNKKATLLLGLKSMVFGNTILLRNISMQNIAFECTTTS